MEDAPRCTRWHDDGAGELASSPAPFASRPSSE